MTYLAVFFISILLNFGSISAYAQDKYEVHMKDGSVFVGIITSRVGPNINLKIGDSIKFIPKGEIEFVEHIQSGQNSTGLKKTNTTITSNEIVFRDFLWSDTPQSVAKKVNNIDAYHDLDSIAATSQLRGIDIELKRKIKVLEIVNNELNGCNSDSVIQYQTSVNPAKDNIAQGLNFYFSMYDDSLLYYLIYIQKKAAHEVGTVLVDKYGEGERFNTALFEWIKWENNGVMLLFSQNQGRLFYINSRNLRVLPQQCKMADQKQYDQFKKNASKQF